VIVFSLQQLTLVADLLATVATKSGGEGFTLIGIEGPVWMIRDLSSYRNNPGDLKLLLEPLRTIEEEPSLIGASAHIMAVGRKA
jgi:hypothetical protein